MTQDLVVDVRHFLTKAEGVLKRGRAGLVGPSLMHGGRVWSTGGTVDRLGRARHLIEYDAAKMVWADGACLAISTRAWSLTGGFAPEYFLYKEDVDFGLRTVRHGLTVECLQDVFAKQTPSNACHYLEVRNRILFARRNLGRIALMLSVIHVVLRTAEKAVRRPRSTLWLTGDAVLGVHDAFTGLLDSRAAEGRVRHPTLYGAGGRLFKGRRLRDLRECEGENRPG